MRGASEVTVQSIPARTLLSALVAALVAACDSGSASCDVRSLPLALVASPRLGDDACAVRDRYLGGAIGGCIVDDDHLAGAAGSPNPLERLVDDLPDRVLFVQAGDDHRDLRGCCQRVRS